MSEEPKRHPRLKRPQSIVRDGDGNSPEQRWIEEEGEAVAKGKAGIEPPEQPEANPVPTSHPLLPPTTANSVPIPPEPQSLVDKALDKLSPIYRGGPQKELPKQIPPDLNIPLTEHQADKASELSLARCQALALQRIEWLLQHIEQLPVDVLLEVVAKIADMRLTTQWTKRLEDAIEQNPSRLTPPGSVRSPLLNKLKSLASKRRQEEKRDGRTSGAKLNRTGTDHSFPQD